MYTEKQLNYNQLSSAFSWDDAYQSFDWNPEEKFNMGHECCDRWAEDHNRIAVYWEDESSKQVEYTFKQLRDKSNQLAHALKSLNVKKGDRVACLLGKDIELVVTVLATWKIGAIYVPLFTAFNSSAISYRLETVESKVLITNHEQSQKLSTINHSSKVIVIDNPDTPSLDFHSLIHEFPVDYDVEETLLSDPSVIQFTSGSTGMPKGAVYAHKILLSTYPYSKYGIAYEEGDIFMGGADPGWAYGLQNSIFNPLSFGIPIVMYKGRPSSEAYYRLMEKYNVTNFAYAPTAYRMMVQDGPELITKHSLSVKKLSSAGEPLNAEVIRFFKKHIGINIHDHYGATEVGMVINNYHAITMVIKNGSMGFPTPGFTISLLDAQGNPTPDGEVGEIAIDTTNDGYYFKGYWNNEEKTAEKMSGKWFLTGDLALTDEEGYYWFQGRSDDIITSSGYRIGPFEVESSLLEHPAVSEAAVVGEPDEQKGEIVKAYVVLSKQFRTSAELGEELSLHVKTNLSKHQYPRKVEFLDELPKTTSGKIQRFKLRK
ncbi:acyl-CoA synthetase [Geomicrobium sp. JCM 19038]|uniref:acyl-CoA synthetase n=1 Tax=Geomicrobium sp. JCM 19038 TaxID=1460635 RepID=UPI00045F2586|nr:AMP-binding protein [Geomicrobium sp. JCM 19038]GAK08414.1 acyl-CoA synthetase/AMP-acid ligase [Geomicrobium sp. JCM 19038]